LTELATKYLVAKWVSLKKVTNPFSDGLATKISVVI